MYMSTVHTGHRFLSWPAVIGCMVCRHKMAVGGSFAVEGLICSATSSKMSEKYPESCFLSHCWKSSYSSAVGMKPCSLGFNVVCKFCHRRYCFISRGVKIAFAETSLRTREVFEDMLLRKIPGIAVWNVKGQAKVDDRKFTLRVVTKRVKSSRGC